MEKETHIHFGCYLYQRCINCVNESLFEMLNIHISTHCDISLQRPRACRILMVKAIGGTKGKSKPYQTIERTDFSNALFWIIRHKLKLLNMNINMGH